MPIADDNSPNGINYGITGESVSPDGTKVAVSTNFNTPNGPESIMVIPVGGSTGPFIATAPTNHNYVFPQWSADGQTIVFEDDGPNNTSTIDTVPAGGGAVTVLTPNDLTARNPTYSPAPNTGGISGTVTDRVGDVPLSEGGVTVQATGSNGQVTTATTDGNGQYKLSVPPGTYTVAPKGNTFMPASRQVTVTSFTSNVDFTDEPIGVVTLGLEELSFGVATYQLGIPAGLQGPGTGQSTPGFIVTKPVDGTSARILTDVATSRPLPVAFLDVYQPGTTKVAFTYKLTNATVEQAVEIGGQPLSESVTVSAKSATAIMVPTCQAIPAIVGVARAAAALVCPLTQAQKEAALAAYQKYADEVANLANSQAALGCFARVDREVVLACAAIALLRAYASDQEVKAKLILDDPPDPRFKKVAKPAAVHPKKIKGSRFKSFNRLIVDLAQIGSLESALVTAANRESGAHNAKSKSGVKLQRAAIARYAKQIITLVGKVKRLVRAAGKPLAGLHAKGHSKQRVVVDFSDLLAGGRDLAAAMRPSAG